ncbi:hypothetical protein QUQ58_004119 [Escherichia coli]|nr:hypothetical protein [Escherichia coli]
MTLKSVHKQLKEHLYTLYSVLPASAGAFELRNRTSCRAIALTFLHQAIMDYKRSHALLGLSSREAIIHMLYEDAGLTITDLEQIHPSLVLKILDPRFAQIDASASPDFSAMVQAMAQWIEDNSEWISRSHEATSDLPELKWSDLPSELFPLTLGK